MTSFGCRHAVLLQKCSRQSDNHYLHVAYARTVIGYDCVVGSAPNPLRFGAVFALDTYSAFYHIVACLLAMVVQICFDLT